MSEFCEGCDEVPSGIELFDPGEWTYCPYCSTRLVTMAEYHMALAEEKGERASRLRKNRVELPKVEGRTLGELAWKLGTRFNNMGVKSW